VDLRIHFNSLSGRIHTDPLKKHTREASSPDSTSGSEAVIEFTKKLQNIPLSRRETFKTAGHQVSPLNVKESIL
jgi:hypothetical protein